MKVLKFTVPLLIALSLISCGDKDITGKYVNTTNSNDILTVSLSKDEKLYVLKGRGKVKDLFSEKEKVSIPFIISTYIKDNSLFTDRNDEKVATIHDDEINLTLEKYGINNITYKKKEQ